MPMRRKSTERPAKRTVILHIRVEDELAQRLQQLADADERKLSPFVARILRQYVAKIDREERE